MNDPSPTMLVALGFATADASVRLLPARWADAIAVGLARAVFVTHPTSRVTLEGNLARLLPGTSHDERRAIARRGFEQFALSFVDLLRMSRLGDAAVVRAVEVRGRRHLERARASGRGVIVVSAHLGNWEWGAAMLAALGVPVHLLARRHDDRWVRGRFARWRLLHGIRGVTAARDGVRPAAALRRGEWLALMADRAALGTQASACGWARALARRTGALVLPAVMLRTGPGRYIARFARARSAESCDSALIARTLRDELRRHPDQWFAFEPAPEGLT